MMPIPTNRQSQGQFVDYDYWSVPLSLAALFCFLLTLILAKLPSHANWLDTLAGRGLRVCSVSAFGTGIVGLFRFRYSRGLAVIALLVSAPLVWFFVVVKLFAEFNK